MLVTETPWYSYCTAWAVYCWLLSVTSTLTTPATCSGATQLGSVAETQTPGTLVPCLVSVWKPNTRGSEVTRGTKPGLVTRGEESRSTSGASGCLHRTCNNDSQLLDINS